MPHIELKYCIEIDLNPETILTKLQNCLEEFDGQTGTFKSRSYHYDTLSEHVALSILLLKKPHRDTTFMQNLLKEINQTLKESLPNQTVYSIELDFLSPFYLSDQSTV